MMKKSTGLLVALGIGLGVYAYNSKGKASKTDDVTARQKKIIADAMAQLNGLKNIEALKKV